MQVQHYYLNTQWLHFVYRFLPVAEKDHTVGAIWGEVYVMALDTLDR